MIKLDNKIRVTQIIEINNNETNENQFLIEQDGKWNIISEEQYKKIIEG